MLLRLPLPPGPLLRGAADFDVASRLAAYPADDDIEPRIGVRQ